jgi:8-oxo-dGTP diphosphatase / 2-hydroxy-dATP diphosphatase
MSPHWFSASPAESSSDLPRIPYKEMWQTDIHWLPLLLANRPFAGRADFKLTPTVLNGEQQMVPYKWWFGTVANSEDSL